MYPNDNQQPVPVDYLNQIAPHQTHKFDLFNKKPVMFAAIGIGILLIFAIFAVIGNLSSSGTKTNEKLAARLKLKVVMINGKNLDCLEDFLNNKPFIGTTIQ